jgi:hypothetical protein
LWDPRTQRPIGDALSRIGSVENGVAWGAWGIVDGQPVLATGDVVGEVRLWDPRTQRLIGDPRIGRSSGARWGAWGIVDGQPVLATGDDAGVVLLWDPRTRRFIDELAGRSSGAQWGAWGIIDGQPILAISDQASEVRLWDPRTQRSLGEPLTGHARTARWGAWGIVKDQPILATGGSTSVRLWEVVEDRPVGASLPPYRSDAPTAVDQLDRAADATAVAELITARSARPPLAVGLFGDWGEGKSHFLGLLHRAVEAAARPGDLLAHGFVRQVRFNAWHYAETDLWASLVTELFAQLASPATDAETGAAVSEQRRQSRLAAELIAARGLPQRLQAARDRRDQLRAAAREPAGLFSKLPAEQQHDVRVVLGDKPEKAYVEVVRTAAAIAHTGRVAGRLIGGVRRAMLVRTALSSVVVALLVVGTVWWLPPLRQWGVTLSGVAAVLVVAASVGRFVRETRRRARAGWKRVLGYGTQQHQRLTAAAEAADAEVSALQREMQDFTAAGQLAGVAADRNSSTDYRSRLSMMSRIRQDFTHMSRLLAQAAAEHAEPGISGVEGVADAAGDELPRIDRIVVYIDDLDRCPPARVVEMLEAVHLLLAVDLFVVVVAVDPRWLLSAVGAHYREVLHTASLGDPEMVAQSVDPDDEALWQSTPTQYLEKIFQVVLTLPPLDTGGYQRMLQHLVGTRTDQPTLNADTAPDTRAPLRVAAESGTEPEATRVGVDDTASGTGSGMFGIRMPAARVAVRVDPFALDPDEVRLLNLLGPPRLISTPRQVKRLANSYGLLTALRAGHRSADLSERSGVVADPDRREVHYRPYRAGLVLLAVLVGYPALGPGLFVHLHHTAAGAPEFGWAIFLDTLRPRSTGRGWSNRDGLPLSAAQAQQWRSLATALHTAGQAAAAEGLDLPEPLGAWAEWVVPVGRLSFPTGRVVSTLDRYEPLPAPARDAPEGA